MSSALRRVLPSRSLLTRHASSDAGFDRTRMLAALNGEHLRAGQDEPAYARRGDKVTFYNMRFCMYAQRTALVLLAKEIE